MKKGHLLPSSILFDSTALIDYLCDVSKVRLAFELLIERGIIPATSSINVAEIYSGMRQSELAMINRFLSGFEILPVTAKLARDAGLLRAELARSGRTIGLPDVIVGATAMEFGFPLVTSNRKDFPMPGVRFYDLIE